MWNVLRKVTSKTVQQELTWIRILRLVVTFITGRTCNTHEQVHELTIVGRKCEYLEEH